MPRVPLLPAIPAGSYTDAYDDSTPLLLLIPRNLGTRTASLSAASGELFHRQYSHAQLCEALWRVKTWRATFSGSIDSVVGAFNGYDWDVIYDFTSNASDEIDLVEKIIDGSHSFAASYISGTTEEFDSDGGSLGPFTPNPVLRLQFLEILAPDADAGVDVSTRYEVDPATGLWLPRVEISGNPGIPTLDALANYSLTDVSGNPTYNGTYTSAGSFHGGGVTWNVYYDENPSDPTETSEPSSFSLSISPYEWWEYRDSTGNNPIWDSSDGTALLDYATLTL